VPGEPALSRRLSAIDGRRHLVSVDRCRRLLLAFVLVLALAPAGSGLADEPPCEDAWRVPGGPTSAPPPGEVAPDHPTARPADDLAMEPEMAIQGPGAPFGAEPPFARFGPWPRRPRDDPQPLR
jgi:hypothetical protein